MARLRGALGQAYEALVRKAPKDSDVDSIYQESCFERSGQTDGASVWSTVCLSGAERLLGSNTHAK